MSEQNNELWNVFEAIIEKNDFFAKLNDDAIVEKWRDETRKQYPNMSDDDFTLAINMIRRSYQGAEHSDKCTWEDDGPCEQCTEDLRRSVIANPKKYGLSKKDIKEGAVDNFYPSEYGLDDCPHAQCNCKPPENLLENYIKYFRSNFIPKYLHDELSGLINDLKERLPIDLHPGSEGRVRNLVHPSMYCYLRPGEAAETRYQWLPAEVHVIDGKSSIETYVNNLDDVKFPDARRILSCVFDYFIDPLSAVLQMDIRNAGLQVIVKIASATLVQDPTSENPAFSPDGSWHIEGMPYEHIAATCIYYAKISNISPSALEFRKLTPVSPMMDYPQNASKYTEYHYGIEPDTHFDGFMNRYLGFVMARESAAVVFPNTLQHRVKKYTLGDSGDIDGERTILAFFVIDPKHRITSSASVPRQQFTMSRETAEANRTELMKHRGKFVKDMNGAVFERSFSLCEH